MELIILSIIFVIYLILKAEDETKREMDKKYAASRAYEASRPKKPQYYPGTQDEWELEEALKKAGC